jgi:hypothetical protein
MTGMTWDERYQKEMIHRLQQRLVRLRTPDAGTLDQRVAPKIESIINANRHMVIDLKTQPHLRLTACILACYQELLSGAINRSQALELLEVTFTSIGRIPLKLYTQALLTFSRDPFITITRAGKLRALTQYGNAWEFRFEETRDRFSMIATKCFYQDFFTAVGAPELTPVFCSWDLNWIGSINPSGHKIQFERPITMGYGGKECPFIFKRVFVSM